MSENIFSRISKLINRIVDIISQGNLERTKMLGAFNDGFRELWDSGEYSRLYSVTTSIGNPYFKHELSTFYLRSGFKITVENDSVVNETDSALIHECVLDKESLIRQLMAMGYDTLIIKGKNSDQGIRHFSLKEFANLRDYMFPDY